MSREKQIDYKEYARQMRENCVKDYNGNIVCSGELWEEIANIIENFAGYRKQEWISVDERLPDKEGTYLTYTDKGNVDLDIFCIYPSHGTKFWSSERRGKVTHWMPLPEAPKMKGEN